MKAIVIGALAASLAVGTALAHGIDTDTSGKARPAPNSVCLWTYQIDHTTVPDAKTILFHMRSGKIWKNTLQTRCPGLLFNGFKYVTPIQQICSNAQTIQVLRTGEVCALGNFEPYTPPKPAPKMDKE